jgi:glycogen synthase
MTPKVLMVGWELPPYNSGGLGVACLGMAKALAQKGVKITFVLPKKIGVNYDFMDVVYADIKEVADLESAYNTSFAYLNSKKIYLDDVNGDYIRKALSYAERIESIARKFKPDIIHSHDWLSTPAGIAAKNVTKAPLIVHFHATEFDRTGGNFPNQNVMQIEKSAVYESDRLLAVSGYTKKILVEKYGASEGKVNVVYNGIDDVNVRKLPIVLEPLKALGYKIVLFLGRITLQKGPEYFLRAAKIVSDYDKKTVFVVVGSGDMQNHMLLESVGLGIMDKMIFTGFLRDEERDRIFQSADLYVMPSVSEPFGITALEAVANKTPVILSKQSGVSEVLQHVLKVDFWDVEEMANKMLAVIRYKSLSEDLKKESSREIMNLTWLNSADNIINAYSRLLSERK